jgi:membrane protein DedA with SNARE-associated domain
MGRQKKVLQGALLPVIFLVICAFSFINNNYTNGLTILIAAVVMIIEWAVGYFMGKYMDKKLKSAETDRIKAKDMK